MMQWTYDVQSHAFYLYLNDMAPASQRELEEGTVVDLATDGTPVGIELVPLTASVNLHALAELGVPPAALDLLQSVAGESFL